MSSGGGSVAKQFAAGGTMEGSLTVSGNISASNNIYANGSKLASENFAVAMAIALG